MAKYRYIFADLLTDKVTVELPLYGTTFSRRICKVGEFGGSFGLNTDGINNGDVINGTIPGRTAVYVERDSQLVWGGIIWSRTWQEQSKSFQYYGQTFDSYLYLSDIRNTLKYVSQDQRNIVIDLLARSQAMPYRGLRIGAPPTFPNNIVRTVDFFWYDAWTFGKAFDYMAEFDNGLDYYVDVRYDGFGDFERRLIVDNRIGASLDDTQLTFDFPGSIKNFWYPENASRGATTISGIGAGEGAASIRSLAVKQALLDGGHPELVQFYTNKDIKSLTTLQSHLNQEMRLLQTPVVQPTYEIESDREPHFGSYALGDYAHIKLDSVRFETPLELTTRIVGWDVKPSQSSGAEEVKIITAGEEDA
jgi:hypothetical protein